VNLTVRVRVGIGMVAVVGLGAVTGALAQWGLGEATRRLERLQVAAQARSDAAQVRRGVSEARRLETAYLNSHKADLPAKVEATVHDTRDTVESLVRLVEDADGRDRANRLTQKLNEWHDGFHALAATSEKRGYTPKDGIAATVIAALDDVEREVDLLKDEEVRDTMLLARIQGNRTSQRREKPERDEAYRKYQVFSHQIMDRLTALRTDPKTDQGVRAKLEASWKAYDDGFAAILDLDAQIATANDDLDKVAKDLEEIVTQVSQSAQAALDKETAAIRDQNQTTQRLVLVGSLLNGLLALVLGAYTVHDLNRRLRAIAQGLTDGAEDLSAAASSVATTATRLSDRTAQQASHLEETSASIEELTATTRQNADNAQAASGLAQKAKRAAEQSNHSMTELHGAMREIQESAARIARIIEVIKEIAFQTNLLALNAAVEAARAGEHGRGFAVVAEEVRSLAQRAAASAKETSGIIGASVQTAEKGGRMVDGVVHGQRQIVDDVQSVARLMEEIAAASREQAEGVQQINQAVVTIDKLTQQNSSAAETGAAAAEELTGQASSVASLVGSLVELVQGAEALGPTMRSAPSTRPAPRERAPSPPRPPSRSGTQARPRPPAAPAPGEGSVPSLTEEELKEF
jgi:predicted esterase YcpF (UPF0227 family)